MPHLPDYIRLQEPVIGPLTEARDPVRHQFARMKTLFGPISAALLASALSVYGCHWYGMPKSELYIAALVAVAVSVPTAIGAVLFKKARRGGHR